MASSTGFSKRKSKEFEILKKEIKDALKEAEKNVLDTDLIELLSNKLDSFKAVYLKSFEKSPSDPDDNILDVFELYESKISKINEFQARLMKQLEEEEDSDESNNEDNKEQEDSNESKNVNNNTTSDSVPPKAVKSELEILQETVAAMMSGMAALQRSVTSLASVQSEATKKECSSRPGIGNNAREAEPTNVSASTPSTSGNTSQMSGANQHSDMSHQGSSGEYEKVSLRWLVVKNRFQIFFYILREWTALSILSLWTPCHAHRKWA